MNGLVLMNTLDNETYQFISKQTSNIVGIDTNHENIDNIGYDHYQAADMAVEHLASCGYREIGYIGGYSDTVLKSRRYRGYYAALHVLGLP